VPKLKQDQINHLKTTITPKVIEEAVINILQTKKRKRKKKKKKPRTRWVSWRILSELLKKT
jgi:hypothetical protein